MISYLNKQKKNISFKCVVVLSHIRKEIIRHVHDEHDHWEREKTYDVINKRY